MPILNYTTEIDAGRTVAEILRILAKAGASQARIDYEDGDPTGVMFMLNIGDRFLPFRLPANIAGVHRLIAENKQIKPHMRTRAQATRVAWRIVKDWVEAQIAFIESGQATLPQLFLPHAVGNDGRTLFEQVAADPRLLLGSGGDPAHND